MLRYVLRRAIFAIPVLLIASVIVFAVVRSSADPTTALRTNPRVNKEDIQRLRAELGIDRPAHMQYLSWLGDFSRGRWGDSLISGRAVAPQIREAVVNTAVLGLFALSLSLIIGMAIGVYSAIRQYSLLDYLGTSGAFLGLSIPVFWFALIVQLVFGVYLTRWLDLSEPIFYTAGMTRPGSVGFDLMDRLRHLALPTMVLAVQLVAVYSRFMRASMLEVLHTDYLRTARAKGVRESRVLTRHGMRNALIPLTTQVAIDLGALAGGLIVTESIFQWPGMGSLFITSMRNGDYTIVLPWTMLVVGSVILFNLIADIIYAVLDPRIRYG